MDCWKYVTQFYSSILIPILFLACYIAQALEPLNSSTAASPGESPAVYSFKGLTPLEEKGFELNFALLKTLLVNVFEHGFVPVTLKLGILDYILFMYFLSWTFVTFIALAYYRKYRAN